MDNIESSVVDFPPECPSNRRVAVATSPLLAPVAVVDKTQDLVAATFLSHDFLKAEGAVAVSDSTSEKYP